MQERYSRNVRAIEIGHCSNEIREIQDSMILTLIYTSREANGEADS